MFSHRKGISVACRSLRSIFLSERSFTLKIRRNFIIMTCIITKNISCLRYVNTRKSYWFGALGSILPLLFSFTGFSLW